MTDTVDLPYFDFLLDLLASRNGLAERSFGRHVHWGYWPRPEAATGGEADYAAAADRLAEELIAAAAVGDGQHVLDAGCGFGGTTALLNERFEHMGLTGLNIDERQLERARGLVAARPSNTVSFERGDACALPYAGRTFDRVLAVECIFHFPSRERFFAEAWRTLRPGGILALTDFVPARAARPVVRLVTEHRALARFQYLGRCNLDGSLPRYRQMARRIGFEPLAERNLTRHTLPTYTFLKQLVRRSSLAPGLTRGALALLSLMQVAGTTGLLNYCLLAYRKPASSG